VRPGFSRIKKCKVVLVDKNGVALSTALGPIEMPRCNPCAPRDKVSRQGRGVLWPQLERGRITDVTCLPGLCCHNSCRTGTLSTTPFTRTCCAHPSASASDHDYYPPFPSVLYAASFPSTSPQFIPLLLSSNQSLRTQNRGTRSLVTHLSSPITFLRVATLPYPIRAQSRPHT